MTTEHDIMEIRDRCRRLETKVTAYLESQGFETNSMKPAWTTFGAVEIPNLGASLKDILAIVPKAYFEEDGAEDIPIVCKGKTVGWLMLNVNYTVAS
jgi:hypothetical protein